MSKVRFFYFFGTCAVGVLTPLILFAECDPIVGAAGSQLPDDFRRKFHEQNAEGNKRKKPAKEADRDKAPTEPRRAPDTVEISDEARAYSAKREEVLSKLAALFKDEKLKTATNAQIQKFFKGKVKDRFELSKDRDPDSTRDWIELNNDLIAAKALLQEINIQIEI